MRLVYRPPNHVRFINFRTSNAFATIAMFERAIDTDPSVTVTSRAS